jgi:hypothetical protein
MEREDHERGGLFPRRWYGTYVDAVGQRACLPVKWQTTTGPDHLHWRETRSLVGVKGTTFTFYPYEFPDAVFSYKLTGEINSSLHRITAAGR